MQFARQVLLIILCGFLAACLAKTPLMQAAAQGNLAQVQSQIAQGADVNQQTPEGYNALMYAIIYDRPQVVAYLLKQGADVNSATKNGTTAFMIAASVGDVQIITLLHEHGANVNAKNQAGITALMAAAGSARPEASELLLQYGASPCLKDENNKTAFQLAEQWIGTQEAKDFIADHPKLHSLLCQEKQP